MSFNLNDVSYYTNIDLENQTIDFSIQNPQKETHPETLYKYYSINKYSIEGFVNHFLFSAHPMTLNDKYDCAGELIDYSNLSLDNFIDRFSKELKLYSEDKVQKLYNSENKWILDRTFADLNHLILFMKFGIISLTEKYDDPLMWAHYSQNSGFVLKLKTTLLPTDFFGPFPINYVDNLTKIDFSKYHSALCVLYQSNVKQDIWATEHEWRYLTYNKAGKYHPFYSNTDINSRKFYYNSSALQGIILGYDFFNPREIVYSRRTSEYDIISLSNRMPKTNRKLKIKLLNYIVNNSLPCSQVIRHRYSYALDVKEIKIEKISPNQFKVLNSFKQMDI